MSDQSNIGVTPVELNPTIDRAQIQSRFAATGRAQIKDILTEQSAEQFFKCLTEELPWRLAFNDGSQHQELTREQTDNLGPQEQAQLQHGIFERATRQFQYAYADYPVAKTLNSPTEPKFFVHDVLRFLNGETFRSFLLDATGLEGKMYADGHATCFQPGHFRTIHDDTDTDNIRVLAYAFNMTRNWRPDWGGALQFFNQDLEIEESFAPIFNALTIYKVPQAHAVSFVPPYAQGGWFGMTGWFHAAD